MLIVLLSIFPSYYRYTNVRDVFLTGLKRGAVPRKFLREVCRPLRRSSTNSKNIVGFFDQLNHRIGIYLAVIQLGYKYIYSVFLLSNLYDNLWMKMKKYDECIHHTIKLSGL